MKDADFKGIENIKFSRVDLNETILTMDLHYFNPNKFKLKIKNAEGDAWMDNNFLGHFKQDTLVSIPANDDFRLPVKLKVDLSHLISNSLTALIKKEVLIRVDGKARVGKASLFVNYPIHYEEKENLAELLKY